MNEREALKLALEALEVCQQSNYGRDWVWPSTAYATATKNVSDAITAIREALAQPETVSPGGGLVPAVPVAVYGYCPVCGGAGVMRERRPNGDDKCTNGHKYPSSKALAQPEQEPVVWMYQDKISHAVKFQRHMSNFVDHSRFYETPLYTTPPQRKQWIGLTQQEHIEIAVECGCMSSDWVFYGSTVERILKEKNS